MKSWGFEAYLYLSQSGVRFNQSGTVSKSEEIILISVIIILIKTLPLLFTVQSQSPVWKLRVQEAAQVLSSRKRKTSPDLSRIRLKSVQAQMRHKVNAQISLSLFLFSVLLQRNRWECVHMDWFPGRHIRFYADSQSLALNTARWLVGSPALTTEHAHFNDASRRHCQELLGL